MMKSLKIIKDAWTGSFWEFVFGVLGAAAFFVLLVLIVSIFEIVR